MQRRVILLLLLFASPGAGEPLPEPLTLGSALDAARDRNPEVRAAEARYVAMRERLLERVFGTAPIGLAQCAAWIALGALPLVALELRKWTRRRTSPASAPAASGVVHPG